MQARLLQIHHKTINRLIRLKREAESDGVYRVANRIHAVLLNHDGHASGEIAQLLRAPRSRVSDWLGTYQKYGYEGLLEGHRSGRPAEMTADHRQRLIDIIDSGPVAYGFLSGVWTSIMIARVIREEFGITYHPGHVRHLLYKIGFSVQRPRRILARADVHKQDRWHRYTYPNLKKTPKPKERP